MGRNSELSVLLFAFFPVGIQYKGSGMLSRLHSWANSLPRSAKTVMCAAVRVKAASGAAQ